jgi:nickel-dependent lactate racemase
MCETVAALNRVFAINFFADKAGNIVFLNAGDLVKSHADACGAYRDSHSYPITDPYDVVVLSAGGYPYDINFLQSHKPLRHVAPAVRRGGALLYFAECEEGVGSERLETALKRKKEEFLKRAYKEYDLNNQTAVSLHELSERYEIAVVTAMNPEALLSCGMKPCAETEAEAFLAQALQRRETRRVAVVEEGHGMLPVLTTGGAA